MLSDPEGDVQVVVMSTGSELSIAVEAARTLNEAGIGARVVSMPCFEWFFEQDQAYRDSVIPPSVKARVSIEAAVALSWYRLLGDQGEAVSLEHYGASGVYTTLYEEYGITAGAVVEAAHRSLARV